MTPETILTAFARALDARRTCDFKANIEARKSIWADRWQERIEQLEDLLPHGSGFDKGSRLDDSRSDPETRLYFTTAFHHMDDNGYYCGWTDHEVICRPSFVFGYTVRITGQNKRNIKDYIRDTFGYLLTQPAPEYPWVNSKHAYKWFKRTPQEDDTTDDYWTPDPAVRDKWLDRQLHQPTDKIQPFKDCFVRRDPSAGSERWIGNNGREMQYFKSADEAIKWVSDWMKEYEMEGFII